MNVVLYLRYSSDKQNEQSIEGQKRICSQYCKQNDMTIIGYYIDRALSASKNIEKRENFQKMIKDSEKREFEAVVVYKLDRFARNRYDSATYKNKLKRNGVKVISATENLTDTPESIILESVLEGMAEFYSKELAQKVTRGMYETALKGNSCGGYIPLGYKVKDKKFVIDPVTAPIVKEAFELFASGESINNIIEIFNEKGYKNAKGLPFTKNSFSNIFKNERYTGLYKYKDVRIENGIPAIIEKELFQTVQRRLEMNKKAPKKSSNAKIDYLLSGKLFCGHCNSPMTGEYGTGKSGNKHYYYTCSGRRQYHSCDKKSLQKEFIERVVVEDAVALLTPENIEKIADIAVNQAEFEANSNKNISALKEEIKKTEKSIENLLKMVERGSDSESLFNRLSFLEKSKKNFEKQLAEASLDVVKLDKQQVKWWLNQFSKGDVNDEHFRRQVIDMLVNSVTVWDEPDGWFRITSAYNLTSAKSGTFRCSSDALNSPPKIGKLLSKLADFYLLPLHS